MFDKINIADILIIGFLGATLLFSAICDTGNTELSATIIGALGGYLGAKGVASVKDGE